MNLAILKKSRRRPIPGDLFVMKPGRGPFLFGRVIRTDANAGGFPNANLIYIYEFRSTSKEMPPDLRADALLLPPILTNNLPWSRGYFECVGNRSLQPGDCLALHCFRDERGWFFDETGRRLRDPVDPVGEWGLHSYRTIDDAISVVLGIPLSAD
jgi:hypothetical protein